MKILNFTATEILHALLKKSKTQTIRPAWKKPEFVDGICVNGDPKFDADGENPYVEKPARCKVGETVKLMWNQRSPHEWFCMNCGKGVPVLDPLKGSPQRGSCCTTPFSAYKFFPKIRGEAVITDVFKIIMGLDENGQGYIDTEKQINHGELAKRDGFKSLEHMMAWFDKRYGLSTPKPFWVYRWEWKQND